MSEAINLNVQGEPQGSPTSFDPAVDEVISPGECPPLVPALLAEHQAEADVRLATDEWNRR